MIPSSVEKHSIKRNKHKKPYIQKGKHLDENESLNNQELKWFVTKKT